MTTQTRSRRSADKGDQPWCEKSSWVGPRQRSQGKTSFKSSFFVDTGLEKEDTEYFNAACQPWTIICMTRYWIKYVKKSYVQPKVTSHLDLFCRILKMNAVEDFMLSKTTHLYKSVNSLVLLTTWKTWKKTYRKCIVWTFTSGNELTLNECFRNLQIWKFLHRYFLMFPWGVTALHYQDCFWEATEWTILRLRAKLDNLTMTTFACLEHLSHKLQGTTKLEKEISNFFKLLVNISKEADFLKFQTAHMRKRKVVAAQKNLFNIVFLWRTIHWTTC